MSIRSMYKKCKSCGKQFSYNPSAGDLGMICPFCHKPANIRLSGDITITDDDPASGDLSKAAKDDH